MKLTKGKIKKYLLKENQSRKKYKTKNSNKCNNFHNSNNSNNYHNCTYKTKQTFNLRTRTVKNMIT